MFQLADRAFARGMVSSSSYVDESAMPRGKDLVMSAAALSKYTSSTDISRKSRKVCTLIVVLLVRAPLMPPLCSPPATFSFCRAA